jgi:hypothetical protein
MYIRPKKDVYENWIQITVDYPTFHDIGTYLNDWFNNNIDNLDFVWEGGARFYFKYETDALTFKLAWL